MDSLSFVNGLSVSCHSYFIGSSDLMIDLIIADKDIFSLGPREATPNTEDGVEIETATVVNFSPPVSSSTTLVRSQTPTTELDIESTQDNLASSVSDFSPAPISFTNSSEPGSQFTASFAPTSDPILEDSDTAVISDSPTKSTNSQNPSFISTPITDSPVLQKESPDSPPSSPPPSRVTRSQARSPVLKAALTVFHFDGGNYLARALNDHKGEEMVELFRKWNDTFKVINKVRWSLIFWKRLSTDGHTI